MTTLTLEPPELVVRDTAAWRRWLGAHHAQPDGVWLVLAKKGTTKPTSLTYDQALEEALCYGWIDGQAARRDEATYRQRFTPRRQRSPWSKRNTGTGRAPARGGADASRGDRRDGPSGGGWAVGGRVPRLAGDRSPTRARRRPL